MITNNLLNLKGIGGKSFVDINLPKGHTSFVVLHKKRQDIQSINATENYRYGMDHVLGREKEMEHANETFTQSYIALENPQSPS